MLASGERVRASADENPDLFWALRGGGGNFGVVTSFLFRLHEVGTVIGGPTFWAVEQGAEVLAAYREFLPSAPRELNGFFAYTSVPPAPPFPEELHLRKVCGVVWCYVGGDDDAAEAMAPLLDALPEPLLHGVQPMPHPALQSAFDGALPEGRAVVLAGRLRQRDPRRGRRRPRPLRRRSCRPGSRPCTCTRSTEPPTTSAPPTPPGPTATRTGARSSPGSTPTRPTPRAIRNWSVDYFDALHPYSAGGAYVNMMMDEGQERVRASYGDNYERLARIKAKYDPGNLLPGQPEHRAGGVDPRGARGRSADHRASRRSRSHLERTAAIVCAQRLPSVVVRHPVQLAASAEVSISTGRRTASIQAASSGRKGISATASAATPTASCGAGTACQPSAWARSVIVISPGPARL